MQAQVSSSIKCVLLSETYSHADHNFTGELTHTYDEKGNLTQSNAHNSRGEASIVKCENYYDEKGQLTKQERVKQGILESFTYFTYYEDGKLKSKEVTQPKINNITLEEYNKNQDLLKKTFFLAFCNFN